MQTRYHLIRNFVEDDSFLLADPANLTFEQLDEFVTRIHVDEVFLALIEYYCYERKIPLNEVINHLEKLLILWAFKKNACHVKRTAELLQIKTATLLRKLVKYRIELDSCR